MTGRSTMRFSIRIARGTGTVAITGKMGVLIEGWNVNENGKRRGGWRFLDSYKLIPMGLDKAAKTFGQAGKIVIDLNTPETERKLWGEYNREDCVQLYDVMTKFHHYVEKVLMGEVGMTAPSTAVKL